MADLATRVRGLLDEIQRNLLERARAFRDEHTQRGVDLRRVHGGRWRAGPGFVIAPWCGAADCEAAIKAETQATIRNMPLDAPPPTGPACAATGRRRPRRGSRSPTEPGTPIGGPLAAR